METIDRHATAERLGDVVTSVRVTTAARLHFGLLAPFLPESEHVPHRAFGGCGLMIEQPGWDITIETGGANRGRINVVGALEEVTSQRILQLARRLAPREDQGVLDLDVRVARSSPHHVGLGSGTQLALALAAALAPPSSPLDAATLARQSGRGRRSAIGAHGFCLGGFLVDGGRGDRESIAPLIARRDAPNWPIVLVTPDIPKGLSGHWEDVALSHRCHRDEVRVARLCELAMLGLLPALAERDHPSFSEALFRFNRLVGESFAPAQGGLYAHRRLEELVEVIRGLGITGVGQSSWGPTLFAITPDQDRADWLVDRLREKHLGPSDRVMITQSCNRGATIERRCHSC